MDNVQFLITTLNSISLKNIGFKRHTLCSLNNSLIISVEMDGKHLLRSLIHTNTHTYMEIILA